MYRTSSSLLKILVVIVFAGATAANGVSAQSRATERGKATNLTGVWTLNKKLSDDPVKALEATQSGSHAGSGGGHAPPGSSGGHGAGRHERGGGMNPEQTRLLEAPGRLTITQTASSITFTDSNGQSQTLTTDSKKQKLPLNNRTVEVKTKWDDGRLVRETDLGQGAILTETYSLIPEARQLHVAVKLESSHLAQPVILRRVYDAAGRGR